MDPLTFDSKGDFKILQLADLHFTNEEGICRDIPTDLDCKGDDTTIEYIEKLLEKEKPNLVVFSGDNINGELVSDARSATFKFAEPVIKQKIPWAVVFGNHDDQNDLSREELLQVMNKMPYSLTERGPLDIPGVGNYFIKIFSDTSAEKQHTFTLYFLDSHSYTEEDEEDEYDYIKLEQLDWIIKSARSFDRKPNAAAFFHIPIWEYNDQDAMYPDARLGEAREDISSPKKNKISALEAFKSAGDIRVTSCGHDHVNDFCMERDGIQLCYGGGGGVGGYGAEHLGWPRRSRIFKISAFGGTISSWKRLHNDKLSMIHYQTIFSL
ncbi:Metallo-dependent phosphatase-like protein [Thamnidium elegans]|nr:Metallo-dependent phosphatase-like protein [Thamnidium elegans]